MNRAACFVRVATGDRFAVLPDHRLIVTAHRWDDSNDRTTESAGRMPAKESAHARPATADFLDPHRTLAWCPACRRRSDRDARLVALAGARRRAGLTAGNADTG